MTNEFLNTEVEKQYLTTIGRKFSLSNHTLSSRLNSETLEIRILTLCPGAWENPIACTQQKYNLNDAPPFSALSYQWGDPENQRPISINGVQRTIRSNLESVLRHIRHVQHPINLWVDAVSINQDDLVERKEQVAIMGQLYSKADRVLMWLGEGDAGSYWVMEYIIQHLIEGYLKFPEGDDKEMIKAYVLIDNLVCRPIWSRIWIAQELILPPEDPIVICGTHSMPWKIFISGIETVENKVNSSMKSESGINTSRVFRQKMELIANRNPELTSESSKFTRQSGITISGTLALYRKERTGEASEPEAEEEEELGTDAWAIRTARLLSGRETKRSNVKNMNLEAVEPKTDFKPRSLHEIFPIIISKEASDDRDLIYGILGLVKEEERVRIHVDYNTMTPMNIFKQAFEVIWTSDNLRSLESLDQFVFSPPDDGNPSWVMDIRKNVVLKYEMTGLFLRNGQGFQEKHAVQVSEDGRILKVRGIYIDSIEEVDFLDEEDFEYHDREMYAAMSRKAKEVVDQPIPNAHPLQDLDDIKQYGSIDATFAGGAELDHIPIKNIVANRSFFITPAGLYGIGHPQIEVGDHIVFIYGMRVPLVLRSISGYYKIIGPARVSAFTSTFILNACHSSGLFKKLEKDFELV